MLMSLCMVKDIWQWSTYKRKIILILSVHVHRIILFSVWMLSDYLENSYHLSSFSLKDLYIELLFQDPGYFYVDALR